MRQLIGKGGNINLSDSRWMEFNARFPDLDLELELKKANRWSELNPSRRWKSIRGFEQWCVRASMDKPRTKREETVSFENSSHPSLVAERAYRGEEPAVHNDEVANAELDKIYQMLGKRR